jgi:flagellar biosynthesis protein FlhF
MGGREVVEITASDEVNVVARPTRSQPGQVGQPGQPSAGGQALNRLFGQTKSAPAGERTAADTGPLKEELHAIRQMIGDLVRHNQTEKIPDLPEELFNAYLQLIESEVADEVARDIVQSLRSQLSGEQIHDAARVRETLVECVSRMIPIAAPSPLAETGRARLVALVGPTGVGKTTTIAKLAANYKLRENRRVGLVTIDTYRIAAVSQLATYAQIIDVPLKVALTPAELKQAVEELRTQCDIILLDTAGRSPNDALKLNELRGFLSAVTPDETHLVLSSTALPSALQAAIDRFRPLGVNRVILTKLDEAVRFGIILQIVRQVDASLSYVTTGQDVPDDIEVSSSRRLAQWIVTRSLDDVGEPGGKGPGQVDVTVGERSAAGEGF